MWLRFDAAAGSAALLGLTTILVIRGVTAKLNVTSTSGLGGAILVGVLLAVAVGVRAPHKVAVWICDRAWPVFSTRMRRNGEPSVVVMNPPTADVSLYWMVVAVAALVAGLCAALLPLLVSCVEWAYRSLLAGFLWSFVPHVMLAATVGFFAVALPLIPVGLLLACVHHLSCHAGQWHTRAAGWYLAGAGLGQAGFPWLVSVTGHVEPILAAAALPLLIASVVAVLASRPAGRGGQVTPDESETSAPALRDRWPTLMRLCIVATSLCCVIVACVGQRLAPAATPGGPYAESSRLAAMLMAAAIGTLLGCRPKAVGYPTVSGFGLACAAAGGVVALCLAYVHSVDAGASMSTLIVIVAGVGTIAYATAYGIESLLVRVGSRSIVGGTLLWRMIIVLVLWFGLIERLVYLADAYRLLATFVALVLVCIGAALIVSEPAHSSGTRRIRLAAVAAAVLVLILTWPDSIRPSSGRADAGQPSDRADGNVASRRYAAPAATTLPPRPSASTP